MATTKITGERQTIESKIVAQETEQLSKAVAAELQAEDRPIEELLNEEHTDKGRANTTDSTSDQSD